MTSGQLCCTLGLSTNQNCALRSSVLSVDLTPQLYSCGFNASTAHLKINFRNCASAASGPSSGTFFVTLLGRRRSGATFDLFGCTFLSSFLTPSRPPGPDLLYCPVDVSDVEFRSDFELPVRILERKVCRRTTRPYLQKRALLSSQRNTQEHH